MPLTKRLTSLFLASVIIVILFIPLRTLSSSSLNSISFFASSIVSASAQGIGGLESNIKSSFVLDPSSLSYSNGELVAYIKDRKAPIKVKLSRDILDEAINVVFKTKKRSFQVSQDQLAGNKGTLYTDEFLRNTEIGKIFLKADSEFASMVWGNEKLLKKIPEEKQPNHIIIQLLDDNNSDYKNLLKDWALPPMSWPKIILSFNPQSNDVSGLVDLEYQPQVTFLSPYGHTAQASVNDRKLGEIPYAQLIQDVKDRPHTYRSILPEVDKAASVTAAMGLITAACEDIDSCQHLQNPSWISRLPTISHSEQQQDDESFRPGDILGAMSKVKSMELLKYQWLEHSIGTFNSKNPWDAPYNTVIQTINNQHTTDNSPQDCTKSPNVLKFTCEQRSDMMKEIEKSGSSFEKKAKESVSKYFKNRSVPKDSSILQGTLAIVDAWNGDLNPAVEELQNAIDKPYSSDRLSDRHETIKLGLAVSSVLQSNKEESTNGSWMEFRMKYLDRKVLRESYDVANDYLENCETNNQLKQSKSLCSLDDLLEHEAITMRAGLYEENVQGRDIAWLYGRFAHLIGVA
jgi:hypothetical protein